MDFQTAFLAAERIPNDIPGWITDDEGCALQAAASLITGRILEIGTWLGRSTKFLAAGLTDKASLLTVDLPLTKQHVFPLGEKNIYCPDGVTHHEINVSKECMYEIQNCESVYPIHTLARKYLEGLPVEFLLQDFRRMASSAMFDLIFADVLHFPEEIADNMPDIIRLMAPGGLLMAHDCAHSKINKDAMLPYLAEPVFEVDSLLIGHLKEKP